MAYFFLKMNRKSWFIFDLSKNDCDFVGGYAKLNSFIFLFLEAGANHKLIWPLLHLKTIHDSLLVLVCEHYLQSRDSNYQIFFESQFTFMIIFLRIHIIATHRENILLSHSHESISFSHWFTHACEIKKGWKRECSNMIIIGKK